MNMFAILIPIVGFDIMSLKFDWEENQSILTFDIKKQEEFMDGVKPQMLDIGYGSPNSIMILNIVGMLLVIYCARLTVLILLSIYTLLTCGLYGCV